MSSYDEHLISQAGGDGDDWGPSDGSAHISLAHGMALAGITPRRAGKNTEGEQAVLKHKIKRMRGELKSLGLHLDSWESSEHATVTIRFMRQWIERIEADLRKS